MNIVEERRSVKLADNFTLDVKHVFTAQEALEHGVLMANALNDKQQVENDLKVITKQYKTRVEEQDAVVKRYKDFISHGWTYLPKSCSIILNFETKKREYYLMENGDFIKEEDFQPSDYKKMQYELDLDAKQQAQMNENNAAGEFADGTSTPDPLDAVITDKKLGVLHSDDLPIDDEDLFNDEDELPGLES